MHDNIPLISTVAVGFGLALVLGFVAVRIKLPALVGYLLAGIAIGPATPGFVADVGIASQLAEIGVMLLMFGVGLHFSLADLLSVRRVALPGAVVQMGVATALGAALATAWGWPLTGAIVFGLALSVASTVVLLKALEGKGMLESVNGRIAVGWLVVEDLAMVIVLVLLPPLADLASGAGSGAQTGQIWLALGRTLLAVAAFVALMLLVGRRALPWLLWQVTRTGARELFTLCVVAAAVSIAYGSAMLFGVSFALGAFFAGMVLRESEFSHRAAEETLSLREAFSVLFFVSVGMLFDPRILVDEPVKVVAVVAIIVLGKSLAALALVLVLRYPLNTALTVSASLAQIGEFSFILAALGVSLGVLPAQGQSLFLAGALISIAINPLLFAAAQPALAWVRERSALARRLDRSDDPLAELPEAVDARVFAKAVVIAGWGRAGQAVAAALQERGIAFIVADNRESVEQLREQGMHAVLGDPSEPATLIQAHVAQARMLVIDTGGTPEARRMIETARTLNPAIEIAMRGHDDEEAALIEREPDSRVFVGEREMVRALAGHVLSRVG